MSAADLETAIARALRDHEQRGALPPGTGIAVAVASREGPIAHATHGLADRERGVPVTTRTRFELGSLTKAVTATAVLQAAEDGAWSLSAPSPAAAALLGLSDSDVSARVSLEDVLSHRTGLPPHDLLWYFAPEGTSAREIVGRVRHLSLIPNGFRRIFSYNNLAYGAVGLLFEDVIGRSWGSFVTERIFAPLGMSEPCAPDEAGASESECARGYVGSASVPRKDLSVVAAAGAWRSNVEDVGRWLAFQLGDGALGSGARLCSSAALRTLRDERVSIEKSRSPLLFQGLDWLGDSAGYGLGWFLGTLHGHRALYHPAYIDGFSGVAVLVPDLDVAVAVLANVNVSPVPAMLAGEIVSRVTGVPLSDRAAPAEPAGEPGTGSVEAVDGSSPEGIEGRYTHPAYGAIEVLRSGSSLAVRYGDHRWPLDLGAAGQATVTVHAFGLDLPLPSSIERVGGVTRAIEVPLALEALAAPVRFSRG